MADTKFYYTLSSKQDKYYKITDYKSYFYAYYKYRDGFFSGENYEEIGKARNYDDAVMICRTHALQFGRIEKMTVR